MQPNQKGKGNDHDADRKLGLAEQQRSELWAGASHLFEKLVKRGAGGGRYR
jgi:hypothetical protein